MNKIEGCAAGGTGIRPTAAVVRTGRFGQYRTVDAERPPSDRTPGATIGRDMSLISPVQLDSRHLSAFTNLRELVNQLSEEWRTLVLEVFREGSTLRAFLNRPASLRFHHSAEGGLLIHTVEVATDCARACDQRPEANRSLTIAAGLLHDIGKCIEYEPHRNGFRRSAAGEREMHKMLGVRLIERAAQRCGAADAKVSHLVHCITAANGPDYMGLPRPKMLEAVLLQTSDARSAFVGSGAAFMSETTRPLSRAQRWPGDMEFRRKRPT